MERVLPPAEERFDPITGRWINAPLPDPARTWVDPAGDAPVTVVGEIPPELSEHDRPRYLLGSPEGRGSGHQARHDLLPLS